MATTIRRIAALTCMAAVSLLGCDGAEPSQPPAGERSAGAEQPGAPAAGATAQGAEPAQRLTFAQALDAAQPRYPDAPAIEVEWEREGGQELLEVEFLVDGGIQEVYLDPVDGTVLREETEKLDDDERAALPKLARELAKGELTLAKGIELALARYEASEVREIELEVHDGEVILEVAVERDGQTVDWVLDPRTGEVRGREADDETHAVEPAR